MPPNGTFAKTFQNISRMSGREIKPTSPSRNTQGSGCFIVYPGHSPTHKSYLLQNKSNSLEQQPSFITGPKAPFFLLIFFFSSHFCTSPKLKSTVASCHFLNTSCTNSAPFLHSLPSPKIRLLFPSPSSLKSCLNFKSSSNSAPYMVISLFWLVKCITPSS